MGANTIFELDINPLNSSKNTKNTIIELLSNTWPLSMKQIHTTLTKKQNRSITYQAVHKAIKELLEQDILFKKEQKYRLNINWIRSIKAFCSNMENSYLKQMIKKENNHSTITVNCLWDLYKFILNSFSEDTFKSEKKSICVHSEYVWISPIGTENEWSELKTFLQHKKMLVLIHSNTPLDKFLKKSWENTGMKYKLGVETENSKLMMDLFIIGEYLIQIYYPSEFVTLSKQMYKDAKTIADFSMDSLQDYFYKKYDEGINILIHKNKHITNRIRKITENEFNIDNEE